MVFSLFQHYHVYCQKHYKKATVFKINYQTFFKVPIYKCLGILGRVLNLWILLIFIFVCIQIIKQSPSQGIFSTKPEKSSFLWHTQNWTNFWHHWKNLYSYAIFTKMVIYIVQILVFLLFVFFHFNVKWLIPLALAQLFYVENIKISLK